MKVKLRQEKKGDHTEVNKVIELAFQNEPISDQTEHYLVEKLRKSASFIPELSIIAEHDREIYGHILLTKAKIIDGNKSVETLALGPVSVLPKVQNKGIGGALMRDAHEKALLLGYRSIVLLGHENYYPRFGYMIADEFGIRFPFKAPRQNCMVKELVPGSLKHVGGMVAYPKEFFVS
ncbi:MAG: N-acetyltransferase [Chitinophagales bacterium]|nr:N-acetyltransferase [Chitinophagales bacterium]